MESQDAPFAKVRLTIAMSGVLILTLAAAFFAIGIRSQKALAPKKMVQYMAPDKSFQCQMPEGWRREERSSGGVGSTIRAESGGARISIISSLSGSLMADIAKSGDAQMQNMTSMMPGSNGVAAGPRPPIEKLHLRHADQMTEKWDDFEDKPMNALPLPLGECRVSEWSGVKMDAVGAGKTIGLRANILNGERLITVLCYCPAADWKTMVPVFSKVIRSMAPGGS